MEEPKKREKTGGRKKGVPNKMTCDLKTLVNKYTPEAIKELRRLALEGHSEAVRVSAIKELLDRGYGRAQQAVAVGGADGGPIEFTFSVDNAKSGSEI